MISNEEKFLNNSQEIKEAASIVSDTNIGECENINNEDIFKNGVETLHREEDLKEAQENLKIAFATLGIENIVLPKIKIKFIKDCERPFGSVSVDRDGIGIDFDEKFHSQESQDAFIEGFKAENEISNFNYPGVAPVLKHELAHIAMWEITGLQKQPATRLLDEGWAAMVGNITEKLHIDEAKAGVLRGLEEEAENYERCLDFANPINPEEELNIAEYVVGEAFLLWINDEFGKDKMIELLQKSPGFESRNDDLEKDDFQESVIEDSIHATKQEYLDFINVAKGNLSEDEYSRLGREWEGKQFVTALLEVTNYKDTDEVKAEFLKWVKN